MPIPEPLHKPRTDWQFQKDVEVLGHFSAGGSFGPDSGYFYARRQAGEGGLGGVLNDLDPDDFPILDLSSDATGVEEDYYLDPSGWLHDLDAGQETYLLGGGWTLDDTGTPTILHLPPGVYSSYFYATFGDVVADGDFLNLYLYPADYNQVIDEPGDAFDSAFFDLKWGTGTGDWKTIAAADSTPGFVQTWQRIYVSGGTLPWFATIYTTFGSSYAVSDLALRIVKER